MKKLPVSTASALIYSALATAPAHADADWDRYAASDYQYCDAVILGAYWGESVTEAKSSIGRKLNWGNADIVAGDIADARRRGERCEFGDTGFSYADAEALAGLWGNSVADAKWALAEKVSTGRRVDAEQLVEQAHERRADHNDAAAGESAAIDRYVDSSYEYCDALLLGALWGESVYNAKVIIGRKLGANNRPGVEYALDRARDQGHRCRFADTGLSYRDAQLVAQAWGSSVEEAKSRLADKVSMGRRGDALEWIDYARNQRG